ncbi:leucine-rich repeat domain-containing protein [Terrimonas sp. NA20]|uniref:Leucine-rich repeat domain-containing protein n=1 Tax=Terrimonas ginsenosidimutans TaxID=2908004 RepID=A0ABS9KN86_9BACT|nr:leucine-rich repeat domain-containing protein [Terrimonas ginsenosidimutans]MCG2613780.1 leucine-rich repeat domain-containing protein [Terrimonas ginsenosidimutans]
MRSILIILFTVLSAATHAQVVRIPDPKFKQRVISLGYDKNDDNQIQLTEAQAVTSLYLNDLDIVNMEGINSFTNLEELGVYNNKLTALDVSKLKKLKYLYAFNNRIKELNITGLTKLEHLFVQDNIFITSLDVSKLTALKELNFNGNRLVKLDLTGLAVLEKIDGKDNNLETISLREAPQIKHVDLKNNPLKVTIDIRGLTNLEYLNLEGSQLLFLNFSGTIRLKEYYW